MKEEVKRRLENQKKRFKEMLDKYYENHPEKITEFRPVKPYRPSYGLGANRCTGVEKIYRGGSATPR